MADEDETLAFGLRRAGGSRGRSNGQPQRQ
jgi:hypothetical protein